MSTTMSIRLQDDINDRLGSLAKAMRRSKASLAAEAIRQFVELNELQLAETRMALNEADAGDFATAGEVAALARKWNVNAGTRG